MSSSMKKFVTAALACAALGRGALGRDVCPTALKTGGTTLNPEGSERRALRMGGFSEWSLSTPAFEQQLGDDDERERESRVALFDACLRGGAAGSLRVQPVVQTSAKTFEGVETFADRVVSIYRTRELFPRVGFLMPPSWVRCLSTAVVVGEFSTQCHAPLQD